MMEQKKLRYNVVSVGGGLSGALAAVASARAGAKTLLLERTGMLGGMNIQGLTLLGIYHRSTLLNEFLSILNELGGICGPLNDPQASINGEILRLVLFRMCRESGVDVLLYSEAYSLEQQKDRVCGLSAIGKNTIFQIETPMVIDATGTGDLTRNADVGNAETLLYAHAAVVLTGLDTAALCRRWEQAFMQKGFAAGQPGAQYRGPLYTGSPVCMITICAEPGRCLVEFPAKCQVNPIDPISRTRAIKKVHLQSYRLLDTLSKTPGFEAVRLSALPPQLVLRQAPLEKTENPADSGTLEQAVAIAIGETGTLQYFHLENLALAQPKGLMVCGKLATAFAGGGQDTNIGAVLATAEAAGICSALAAQKNYLPREINPAQIRERLGLEIIRLTDYS